MLSSEILTEHFFPQIFSLIKNLVIIFTIFPHCIVTSKYLCGTMTLFEFYKLLQQVIKNYDNISNSFEYRA